MSDCISLIDSRVDFSKVAQWVNVSQMTHVLHTEPVNILSVAGGMLQIEPFCIPDMDCRIVGGLVYHCCGRGLIHSWDREVIRHVFQTGVDTCIRLDCWDLNAACSTDEPDICWVKDPCARLAELQCCEMEWLKVGKKTAWSFRDASGSTSFLSESRLRTLISQAEAECEASACGNSRALNFSCWP